MSSDRADEQLDDIVDELYALPAASFTAVRNSRAKVARGAGDRALAAAITALPKPSASAALVNRLVRDDASALQRVIDLGEALRQAQDGPDRERLRELGTRRRDLLTEVARVATGRAEQDGMRVSAAVLEEFQQTLQAALVSEDASRAVRSGRLVRALEADGLDPVDLTDAVAGSGDHAPVPRPSPATAGTVADAEQQDAQAAARAEERARVDARAEAERRARETREAADAAAEAARQADALVTDRQRDLDRLEGQLAALRAAVEAADRELTTARAASAGATETASEATRVAADAEAAARHA